MPIQPDNWAAIFYSPEFWISTIIFGFIISIVGNVATNWLQEFTARFSTTQRAKLIERRKEFEQQVQLLLVDPTRVNNLKTDVIYTILRSLLTITFLLIISNALYSIPADFYNQYLSFLVNFIASIVSVQQFSSTLIRDRRAYKLLREYENRLLATNANRYMNQIDLEIKTLSERV